MNPCPSWRPVGHHLVCRLLPLLLVCFLWTGIPVTAQGPAKDPYFLYHDGLNAYRTRRLEHAKKSLEELVKQHPKHAITQVARLELARLYRDLHEFDKAIALLKDMAETNPESREALMARELLLDMLYDLQRFKAGIDLLEGLWEKNKTDTDIGKQLARFYLQTGRKDEARLLLETLLERTSRRDVFDMLLNLSVRSGEVESLMNAIERRRVRYRVRDYLDFISDCHIALGERPKAIALLQDAEATGSDVHLLKKLASWQLAAGSHEDALKTYRKLATMLPREWEIVKAVGHCHFLLKHPDQAIETWRSILSSSVHSKPEAYQFLCEVLIEHQLYEETLKAFDEARRQLGAPTRFAEERAGVLEAMGRAKEALTEYLLVFENGVFKPEIFDKLWQAHLAREVDLKARLTEALRRSDQFSLRKALLEVYFLEGDPESVQAVLDLFSFESFFDQLVYERIRQESFQPPSPFLERLIVQIIRRAPGDALALKLSLLALRFPAMPPSMVQRFIEVAEATAKRDGSMFPGLQAELLAELGNVWLHAFGDAAKGERYLQAALEVAKVRDQFPNTYLTAMMDLGRLRVLQGNFAEARRLLQEARTSLDGSPAGSAATGQAEEQVVITDTGIIFDTDNVPLDPTFLAHEELGARLLFEEAFLGAHEGNLAEALSKLGTQTESAPGSLWMNEGLDLALFLTMSSTQGPEPIKTFLAAERQFSTGNASEAVSMLQDLIRTASGTYLERESQARVFTIQARIGSATEILPELETYLRTHPAHHRAADLAFLRLSLMERGNVEPAQRADAWKDFIDRFPGDLRVRQAKLALARLVQQKRNR